MPAHDTNWRDSISRLSVALQIPDLRGRMLFVAGMFGLFIVGLHVPAPFVNPKAVDQLMGQGAFGLFDMMSGGALRRLSILALGIVPYINSSIIMQLLGIAVPQIQRLQKEGESGRKVISTYTRIGTVVLSLLQGAGFSAFLYVNHAVVAPEGWGWMGIVPLVIVMAAGTSFLMWMGEQLTDKGIGNGISLIIFAGILIRLPYTLSSIISLAWQHSENNAIKALLLVGSIVVIFVAIVVFITFVHQATRQIPIQHAKRVVGNRVFSTANTYLPLKIATAGVIPIIFAISVVMLPPSIAAMLKHNGSGGGAWINWLANFNPSAHWFGAVIYFLLVVFFTYFYTAVIYNVQDISDNLKKNGSFIPGLRPGKQTEKYIDNVMTRITFAGALFLGTVALLPYAIPVLYQAAGVSQEASFFPLWGGTSLLIVVGVALETMKQIEAHLVMRRYEGFIK